MPDISSWIIAHYDELLGTIISLIYLYFSIKQNILLWPWGLVSSAIYVYVFYKAGIYADMTLQVYYVIISVFGWYNWKKMQGKNNEPSPVKTVFKTRYLVYILLCISGIIYIAIFQLLVNFTDSNIPYLDSFITTLSITATWMLAKKYLEQWIVWILVDTVSAAVYFYKGLYITIFLYAIYAGLAFVGYTMWRKEFNKPVALV